MRWPWKSLVTFWIGWASVGAASEPRVLCDVTDPQNRCPGLDCVCIPDSIEIVFDRTSTNVFEYPAFTTFPIEGIEVTVYMDVKTAGVLGWSFGVMHDQELLEVTEATTIGTDVREKFDVGYYDRTTYVDVQTCVPGTQCRKDQPEERTEGGGWVSTVIPSLSKYVSLDVGRKISLARATYRLKKDVGSRGTWIRVSSGLAIRGQLPVDNFLSVEGKYRLWTTAVDGLIRRVDRENCWNGVDDDGDRLFDLEDPDCAYMPSGAPHVLLEVDAEGAEPSVQGRDLKAASPGAEFEASFWILPMFLVGISGPQSWSISVEHTPQALAVLEATIDGTDAGALLFDGFQRTEIVDPAQNGGRAGFVSAVVLSVTEPRALDPSKRNSLARARYRVLPSAGPSDFPAVIEFSDGLRGSSGDSVRNEFVFGVPTEYPELTFSLRVWQGEPSEEGTFVRGDANDDGTVDISDAIWILRELFRYGPRTKCKDAADVNDDGMVDISDPLYLIRWAFLGGFEPPDPFGECGRDWTLDGFWCPKGSVAACP